MTTELGGLPGVWVEVRNDGRQPITVKEAGFYGSELPLEIDSQDHGKLYATGEYKFAVIREPVLLTPGVYERAVAPIPDSLDWSYHADFPLRVYADDARGRRSWGTAGPVIRMALGEQQPPGVPDRLWKPTSSALDPARVIPTWKLWTRRELRRGESGRPSADELDELTR